MTFQLHGTPAHYSRAVRESIDEQKKSCQIDRFWRVSVLIYASIVKAILEMRFTRRKKIRNTPEFP